MGQLSNKRNLRPRTEVRNYVESPDLVVVSDLDEIRQNGYVNGYDYSDTDDEEMPMLPPVKVILYCIFLFIYFYLNNYRVTKENCCVRIYKCMQQ